MMEKIRKDDLEVRFLNYDLRVILLPESKKECFIAVPFDYQMSPSEVANMCQLVEYCLTPFSEPVDKPLHYNAVSFELKDKRKAYIGLDEGDNNLPLATDFTAIISTLTNNFMTCKKPKRNN